MRYYRAFGLTFGSTLVFPELLECEGPEDVEICEILQQREHTPKNVRGFVLDKDAAHLEHPAIGFVNVEAGGRIAFLPASSVDRRFLRMFLLGPAMAMLLHQRGSLVLHASAVAINGMAVLFVGEKGRGKSTLTTALHEQGCEFVTDDVAALDVGDEIVIRSSVPLTKVDPDALSALNVTGAGRFALGGEGAKVGRTLAVRIASGPVPVTHIFALQFGSGPILRSLAPQSAFAEIVRHTFAARWLPNHEPDPAHFSRCASLVSNVPVSILERPKDFSLMDQTIQLILSTVGVD